MSLTMSKDSLTSLLKLTQRPHNVAGKTANQVNAVMLKVTSYPKVMACSLVKDGLSSVSLFTVGAQAMASPRGNETTIDSSNSYIPITDIDAVLGALQYHGQQITLTHKEGTKLLIKSKSKQTTLTCHEDALAFPHSPQTLKEWFDQSLEIAGKIGAEGTYIMSDGTHLSPFCKLSDINVTSLHEALRCVNVNKQKLNEYKFIADDDGVKVITGDELKGQTEYTLIDYSGAMHPLRITFEATFGGGLDYLTKIINKEKVNLYFIDMTQYQQGIKMVMEFDEDNFILQSSIGKVNIQ